MSVFSHINVRPV